MRKHDHDDDESIAGVEEDRLEALRLAVESHGARTEATAADSVVKTAGEFLAFLRQPQLEAEAKAKAEADAKEAEAKAKADQKAAEDRARADARSQPTGNQLVGGGTRGR